MKVVINVCFGGFGLSRVAIKRWAELQGRECYFFEHRIGKPYVPAADETAFMVFAFDIPNPNGVIGYVWPDDPAERQAQNERYRQHVLNDHDIPRNDPLLVQIVEELGEAANGQHAELRIVEIPDGVEWEIDEYDGNEHIAEKHQTWR